MLRGANCTQVSQASLGNGHVVSHYLHIMVVGGSPLLDPPIMRIYDED